MKNAILSMILGLSLLATNSFAQETAIKIDNQKVVLDVGDDLLKVVAEQKKEEIKEEVKEVALKKNDVHWLAQNIYYESRGTSREAQAAVAHVTMNRVKSGKYPNSIYGVVTQRVGRTCQFSWVCHKKSPPKGSAWTTAINIAEGVLSGRIKNPVGRATNFHSVRINPGWKLKFIRTLGGHKFYAPHR